MILEFNQIDRQPNPLFEGKIKGQIVVTGKGTTHFNDGSISFLTVINIPFMKLV